MPPQEDVYHCQLAPAVRVPATERVDDDEVHIEAGNAPAESGAEGVRITFTVIFLQTE